MPATTQDPGVYYLRPRAKVILTHLKDREGEWIKNMDLIQEFGVGAMRRCRELIEGGKPEETGLRKPPELEGGVVERANGTQIGYNSPNTSYYRWEPDREPEEMVQGRLF
jgi:hypothetical protein